MVQCFRKKKKVYLQVKIAVLLAEIGYDSQCRFLDGILKKALPDQSDVYIFTCDAEGYTARNKYESGEFIIYSLPDFSCFDAVIVNLDTIHSMSAVSDLTERLRASGKPCISINREIEGFVNILLDNYSGLWGVLDHLHTVHSVNSAFYISGPEDNVDAQERLATVTKYFGSIGRPLGREDIAWGDYTLRSGYVMMDTYLRSGRPLPDAVLAANDKMAIGALNRLKESGIRVPEDVIVTGYDNSNLARISYPGLTSVSRDEIHCGSLAYEFAKQAVTTGVMPESIRMEGKPVFSSSCGCEDRDAPEVSVVREKYARNVFSYESKLNQLKALMAEATALSSYEELLQAAKTFIKESALKEVYIAINDDPEEYKNEISNVASGIEIGRDITAYSEKFTVDLAYKDGVFYDRMEISRQELIPQGISGTSSSNLCYFLPLHHQEHCYGYIAFANQQELIEEPFMQLFTLLVSNSLESVYQRHVMEEMMKRLDVLRVADELTGVLNRAGAKQYYPSFIAKAFDEMRLPAILFADMDSLKSVNDRFGHEEGDRYITAIASVLKASCGKDDILTRFGGDEFVIITSVASAEELDKKVRRIRLALESYNIMNPAPYDRGLSIGKYISTFSEDIDLDAMISLADEEMYFEKRSKKRSAAR